MLTNIAIVSRSLGKRLINGPNGPNGPFLKLYEILCPNCPNKEQSWGLTRVEAAMDIECQKCGTDLTPEGA
jgi:ribosomal protein S27E